MNAGNLFRTAHAFGASFTFTVAARHKRDLTRKADTSKGWAHVPFRSFPGVEQMVLPDDCQLVGIELADEAVEPPSFRHPLNAAMSSG